MSKRLEGLDCLRILYAAVICAFHTVVHLGCDYGFFQPFISNGAVLMTSFFMLSGFSLAISYRDSDSDNVKRFYLRRLISIVPMYYICAFASNIMHLFYSLIEGGVQERIKEIILLSPIEILGLQSILDTLFPYNHNGGTWFISCLLICYFFFPYLMKGINKLNDKQRSVICALLYGVVVYSSFVVKLFHISGIYTNPFIRMFEFSIGLILGIYYVTRRKLCKQSNQKSVLASVVGFCTLVLGCSAAYKTHFFDSYMLFSVIVIPCTAWMILSSANITLRSNIIVYLSRLSYCFFLAQLFSNNICKVIIQKISITQNIGKITMGWLCCIAISVVLHHLIELPLTQYLKKKYL